ncbi:type I restriction modification protein [Trueperella pyogenes]|uniref:restriction endonuclease subunit S n=1 Tax=Trueperella pyogenes TaxID=1661 RepID=UPI00043ABFFB|nr:restriction endonuclease subunit S [Trueperella pyogenes]AHU89195.1 type I restriction modification protein [Trueperella pyogenes]AWA43137.1 restriction endonuclease subunit S [Trueperella pyogenes]
MARKKTLPLIEDFDNIPAEALVPKDEQPYEIPEHWKWVRIGCAVKATTEKTEDFSARPPYVGLENLIPGGGIGNTASSEEIRSTKTVFSAGQILYGKLRPYLDKHAVADFDGVCSTDILAYIPSPEVNAHYFDFWLSTNIFRNAAVSHSKGINLPRISETAIGNFPFPLPPLDEQQRIVDYLDTNLAKIDEVIAKLEDHLAQAEERKATLIQAAVSGHLTADWRAEHGISLTSWQPRTIDELGTVVTGNTPSTKRAEFYGSDIPFIKPADLNEGRNVVSAESYLSMVGAEHARMLPPYTVAVCCIGATISKSGLIVVESATNQQINSIIPNSEISPIYLYYLCASPAFRQIVIRSSSSTTLPILNKGRFSKLEVTVPSLEEQQEIARILDDKLDRFSEADSRIQAALDLLNLTTKKIVSAALTGQLV